MHMYTDICRKYTHTHIYIYSHIYIYTHIVQNIFAREKGGAANARFGEISQIGELIKTFIKLMGVLETGLNNGSLPPPPSPPTVLVGGWGGYKCFALSPRRPYGEYKRMVLEHTHGLFIT